VGAMLRTSGCAPCSRRNGIFDAVSWKHPCADRHTNLEGKDKLASCQVNPPLFSG
jgi:hypothetical protein